MRRVTVITQTCLMAALTALPRLVRAEMLHLKDGKRIEAAIIRRDEKSVTVDWYGVPITYWQDEIEQIEEGVTTGTTQILHPQPSAAPAVPGHTGADSVAEFLRLSGMRDQLATLLPSAKTSLAQRVQADERLKTEEREQLHAVMTSAAEEAFRDDLLQGDAAASLAPQLDPERLAALKEQLSSPLLRRVTSLESAATGDVEGLEAFVTRLQQQPPAAPRLALVDQLLAASGGTDALIDSLVATLAAMRPLEGGEAASADFDEQMRQARAQFTGQHRNQFEAVMRARSLYAYRDLTDEELERYVRFLESKLGRWYTRVGLAALTHAQTKAAERFSRGLLARRSELQAPQP